MNQGLREAVLSMQRRSEEHDRAEREWRTTTALFTHEVANSLNSVFACLQLLDMKAQEQASLDPEVKSLLESAQGEIKLLSALLKDFRSFSQPRNYDFEPTHMRKLIDEVIAEDKHLYDSAGVQLELDFPDTLLSVRIDREKIKQAVLRICKNAVEAMPSGGVLRFRGYECDGRVILEIGDTGAGIPEGLKVFEPFHTTKPRGGGLGLPIVSQIISAHKGSIDYVSDPEKGTTFKISLPGGQA